MINFLYRNFLYFGRCTPELFLDLGMYSYAELERKKRIYGKTNISKLASFPNWFHISFPSHFFHGHTSKRLD